MGKRLRNAVLALPPAAQARLRKKLFYDPLIRQHNISADAPGLFDTVFFEVITRCNSRCNFCAASVQNEVREKKLMEFPLYASVLDQLADLGFAGRVAWHVNNDPLLFPDLTRFVSHARERLPEARLQVMTNGLLLTPESGEELIRAGVDDIHVDFYRKTSGQKLYPGLRAFMNETIPRYFPRQQGCEHYSEDGSRKLIFEIEYRFLGEIIASRGGTSPNKKAEPSDVHGFCIFPWSQFNITADGRVSKCCADFHFSDPMGDVTEQSLMDIWQGEKFQHVRRHLIEGDRNSLPICRECDYFGFPNKIMPSRMLRAVRHHFFTCRDVEGVD